MDTESRISWRPPASYFQEALYHSTDDHRSNYNVGFACTIDGLITPSDATHALTGLAQRHEALRTAFHLAPSGVSQVVYDSPPLDLWHVDVSATSDPDAELHRILLTDIGRPFDLARPPLWRAAVVRLADRRHALVFAMHHVICDGASTALVLRDTARLLASVVTSTDPALPQPGLQFGDYAVWERGRTDPGREEAWRMAMDPPPSRLRLPVEPGWSRGDPFQLAAVPLPALPPGIAARFRATVASCGARLSTALYAVAVLSLAPYLDGDFLMGVATANRSARTRHIVGPLFDYLPIRVRVANDSRFRDVVAAVADDLARAREQRLPLGRLEAVLSPGQRLYDVCVNVMSQANPLSLTVADGRLRVEARPLPIDWLRTNVDREFYGSGLLGWVFRDTPTAIGGLLYSNAAAISGPAHVIARAFPTVAQLVVENPDLPLSVAADLLADNLPLPAPRRRSG